MKKIGNILLAGVFAQTLSASAQGASALESNSFELNRITYMKDLVDDAKKAGNFTDAELAELDKIQLIPVYGDKKTYGVPTPITAADNWVENRYSVNLAVTEKLAIANLKLLDTGLSYMGALTERLAAGTVEKEDPALLDAKRDVAAEVQKAFIDICKGAAGLTPFDPREITTFEEALIFVSDVMKILPSVNAQIKLAYGYPMARAAVYSKAKALLPDIKFQRLTPSGATLLSQKDAIGKSLNTATDPNSQQAVAQQEGLRRLQTNLAQDLTGIVVGGAGTTVSLDFTYQLVRAWGVTADSNYLGAGSYMLPGRFEAKWPVSVAVDGNVHCSFNARIREGYYFNVTSTEDGSMADFSNTIPGAIDRSDVKCEFKDSSGKLLSTDGYIPAGALPSNLPDRNAAANSLNVLIGSKIQDFKEQTQRTYTATKSLKTEFLRAAVAAKEGWKVLPVPMRQEDVYRWETVPGNCTKIPREISPRKCKWVVSTKYPRGKQVCQDAVYEFDEVCEQVQRKVWEVIEKPMIVVYPKNGETIFDQMLNQEMDYKVNATETQNGVLAIENDVCIRRVEISNPTPNRKADFLNCDSKARDEFVERVTDDVNGTPVTPPTPGVQIPD